ncbi:MAG TPA: metallophosphoesterase, partial [Candidatus Brocadiia bacterium]|nr:metallophosphoesterase [Candidatus Brocadiia bacterium]
MRILHIADLHLRAALPGHPVLPERLGRQAPQLLARAVAAALPLKPDLAVLAGDLLDYPFDAFDDPNTLDLGEQDLRLIADLLKPLPC